MAGYISVDRDELQKAFALAHKLSENPDIGSRERKYFRAIAHLIWKSCGEAAHYPEVAETPAIAEQLTRLASIAESEEVK